MSHIAEFPPHDHDVRFYDEDDRLVEEVAEFLDSSLRGGGLAVVIATAGHRVELARRLSGFGKGGCDSDGGFSGQLTMLDAAETLAQFMVEGRPDAGRFEDALGPVLRRGTTGMPLHAFGEMVALLCEQGNYEGALQLELIWNEAAQRYAFSLFCAYPWQLFSAPEQTQAFQHVCAAHSRVLNALDSALEGRSPEPAPMTVPELQQQARALRGEVARRQRAEETLRQRERELAEFLNNASEGIHKVAADGTILYANRAELELLGYRWEEYVGRNIADFYVDGSVIDDILRRLKAGEVLRDQPALLLCKDGSRKPVLICSNGYFEDGELRYTRCFTRDASERVARDEALKQRDSLIMQAPVGAALLLGAELRIELANAAYCEMVGRRDVVGKPFAELFPESGGAPPDAVLRNVLRSGEPHFLDACALTVEKAQGPEERFFQFTLQPMRSPSGAVDGVILVALDVTQQMRTRNALLASASERERLVEDLREASRAKDEFLAMLGHELRNPLSPIVMALQLMRMRGDTGTAREQGIIQRQVEHLVRLVDDLLDISRITRGKIELKRQPCEVQPLLAKAVEQASVLLEQRKHELTVDVRPSLQCVCDPVRIAQVVANLLTNAARYTEPGGRIALSCDLLDDAHFTIRVRDNGRGIVPEMLPRIFELFYQGPRGIDRAEGGLGVGLALVRSLVELHGGHVTARSEGAGRGSEFTVCLPLAGAPPEAPAADAPHAAPSGAEARRVLLVDDNVDAAQTTAELLRAHGHEVVVHHDPVSALAALDAIGPDVALLDIGLPVMDGYELGARIRAARGPACYLVALTGYGQDADKARTREAGFDHHLVKPVAPPDVLAALQRSGQGSRLQ
jgi:PAS domain S-box-containing protein